MGAYQGKEITVGDVGYPGGVRGLHRGAELRVHKPGTFGRDRAYDAQLRGSCRTSHKLLDGFRERWTLDRRMTKDDLSAAAEWVNGFEEKYGEVSRFLFEE